MRLNICCGSDNTGNLFDLNLDDQSGCLRVDICHSKENAANVTIDHAENAPAVGSFGGLNITYFDEDGGGITVTNSHDENPGGVYYTLFTPRQSANAGQGFPTTLAQNYIGGDILIQDTSSIYSRGNTGPGAHHVGQFWMLDGGVGGVLPTLAGGPDGDPNSAHLPLWSVGSLGGMITDYEAQAQVGPSNILTRFKAVNSMFVQGSGTNGNNPTGTAYIMCPPMGQTVGTCWALSYDNTIGPTTGEFVAGTGPTMLESSTVVSSGSDGGGAYVTLTTPVLLAPPLAGVEVIDTDTNSNRNYTVVNPTVGVNTTSKVYLVNTTNIINGDNLNFFMYSSPSDIMLWDNNGMADAPITYANLPTPCTIIGQRRYCTDCKSVADGATMAAGCVAGGTGSEAICKGVPSNTHWTCGQ